MAQNTAQTDKAHPPSIKYRHEGTPSAPATEWALRVILLVNLILVPLALFALGEERGPIASLKYLTIGFAAAAATYAVNRFALERLAPLHAIGFRSAGAAAIIGILITGAGTALGSLTGVLYGAIEARIYQASEQELTSYIGATHELALAGARIGPSVEAVAEDIARTKACEVTSACLSNTSGGPGPMSRALETASGQAFGLVEALQAGQLDRERLLGALNDLGAEYRAVLGDQDRALRERRAELQALHAEILQTASTLREAVPVALVQAYAADLQAGANLRGDPQGSRILSAYLREHGRALADQLDDVPEAHIAVPHFPERPGMLNVLAYVPAFLAIAAIVFVGELCLPITMYAMTFLRLSWEIERREVRAEAPMVSKDGFGGLIDPPKPIPRPDPETLP